MAIFYHAGVKDKSGNTGHLDFSHGIPLRSQMRASTCSVPPFPHWKMGEEEGLTLHRDVH